MEEDLLNYYSKREKEEYKRRLEFMKSQAIFAKKQGQNQGQGQGQGNYNNNIMNPIPYRYNGPNMEQALQREKHSSQSYSLGTRKSKKQQNNYYYNNTYKPQEDISEIKEESNLANDKLSKDIQGISKDTTAPMISLKEFVKLYTPGEYGFKKFVKKACKETIIDILKSQPFAEILTTKKKDEMYSEGHTVTQSATAKERKERNLNYIITTINQKILNLFNALINNITEDNITKDMQDFFRFITGENNFVPYSFYSLFELSRIHNTDGYTQKMNSNQKRMIAGIYIILKILVYYYLMQYNFIKDEDKSKVDEDTKLNLKIIASIIYHQLLRMIKKVCQVVETVNDPKEKRAEQTAISKNIKLFIEKIEKHFIKGDPDTNEENIEFIEFNLFRSEDIQKYLDGNKKNNFSLSSIIFDFINKFCNFVESSY